MLNLRDSKCLYVRIDFVNSPIPTNSRYVDSFDLGKTTLSLDGCVYFFQPISQNILSEYSQNILNQPISQNIGSVNVSEKTHQQSGLDSTQGSETKFFLCEQDT